MLLIELFKLEAGVVWLEGMDLEEEKEIRSERLGSGGWKDTDKVRSYRPFVEALALTLGDGGLLDSFEKSNVIHPVFNRLQC